MNKAEAKRDACFHAALVIDDALAAGWQTDDLYPDPKDHTRFIDALRELTDELKRRGRK